MTATTQTASPVHADIYDRGDARYLLVTQVSYDPIAGNRTIAHVRLTEGKNGKGTWAEVKRHLGSHGYRHTGWRQMSTCQRSILAPAA